MFYDSHHEPPSVVGLVKLDKILLVRAGLGGSVLFTPRGELVSLLAVLAALTRLLYSYYCTSCFALRNTSHQSANSTRRL